MVWNRDLLLNDPVYWGTTLPDANDYNGDLQAYLDAVQAAHDADPTNSGLAYAAPTTFTAPDGQTFSAAGYHGDRTPGEQAAAIYNWHLTQQANHQVKGAAANGTLALLSRIAMHPEEAQAAYDAYTIDPDTGLPQAVLNPAIINLMEQAGIRPTPAPEAPGVNHPPRSSNRPPRDEKPSRGGGRDRGTDGLTNAGNGVVNGPNPKPVDPAEAGGYPPELGVGGKVMPPYGTAGIPFDQQMHAYMPISGLSTMHPDYPDFILNYVKQRQGGPVAPTNAVKGY